MHIGSLLFVGHCPGTEKIATNKTTQKNNNLVFVKLTVEGHVFIYFPRSIKLKNLSKILHDSILLNPFLYIHKRYSHPTEYTHFVIVPQNQWNFIDFTGSVVLKYDF